MNMDSLQQAVQHAGLSALVVSFLAGLVFSFNPVALAALPVSLAYVTKARSPREVVIYAGMFIAGMIGIHVVLGAIAGLGGRGVQALLGRYWGLVLGPWLILMGLLWLGWLKLPWRGLSFRVKRATSVWGALVLGAVFAVAICPACTPALVVLLGVGAGSGSPAWAALLLLAFALGRAIPIALGAGTMGLMEQRFSGLVRQQRLFESAGGVALILMGVYMLNTFFFWIPELAA